MNKALKIWMKKGASDTQNKDTQHNHSQHNGT